MCFYGYVTDVDYPGCLLGFWLCLIVGCEFMDMIRKASNMYDPDSCETMFTFFSLQLSSNIITQNKSVMNVDITTSSIYCDVPLTMQNASV